MVFPCYGKILFTKIVAEICLRLLWNLSLLQGWASCTLKQRAQFVLVYRLLSLIEFLSQSLLLYDVLFKDLWQGCGLLWAAVSGFVASCLLSHVFSNH